MNLLETEASHRSAGILAWARFAAGYKEFRFDAPRGSPAASAHAAATNSEYVNPARLVTPFVSMPCTRYIS
jgi:hypothetical protein